MRSILLVFLLLSKTTFACSCFLSGEKPDIAIPKAAENSGAIFVGQVLSVVDFIDSSGATIQSVTFNVTESFKGVTGNSFQTETNINCCVCGSVFFKDEVYLVYTHLKADGKHTVSICSRTKLIDRAETDLAILRTMHH